MTHWLDTIYSVFTLALFIAVVTGAIYVVKTISTTIDETKKSLHDKGVNVSASGISVKTSKHMTREDYLDATQRNFVKAIQTSTTSTADSGGTPQHDGSQHHPPSIKRSSTSSSNRSVESAKKKSNLFGIRKTASKHSNNNA
ncbi:hypothetical protein BJ322DRAFT_1111342 [Thelephora terrestris]|uniref:Uncharacterized protein n=1 Tax=Thelephora terrestris TaxID=56493 RepID=A0A9P6HA03_9AGAM|nr:hypothetical protein BJ322DRAFT_1111342 [Thelephora terrestris]